jgi:signal transduction histidine kinase
MLKLLIDRYFWLAASLIVAMSLLTYAQDLPFLSWLPNLEEWQLSYLALVRIIFLLTVVLTSYRFGMNGGIISIVISGVITMPHTLQVIGGEEQLDLLMELFIISAVGIALSWLISNNVTSQARLKESHNRLEHRVDERTAELGKAYEKLEQELLERKHAQEMLKELYQREKDLRQELETEMAKRIEFTRALVHELKTPLTPMLAASEFLSTHIEEEPLVSFAKNVRTGALNLSRRIDELLDLAKGEVGMLELRSQKVDTLKMIKDLAEYVTPQAAKNEQIFVLETPDSLPPIWADEERLRQVMLNFISNAFKFTRKKGRITLRANQDNGNLVVEVEDTGSGIPDIEQKWLFQPHHRKKGDKERLGGLGLGLSLSKMLVELHGGKIWAKSKEGEGSTFSFSVPIKNPAVSGVN